MRLGIPKPSQAAELFATYKATPTDEVRNRIIVAYMPLVEITAKKLHFKLPAVVQEEDLIAWGVLGLMKAIYRFDTARGLQFHTFARSRVHGRMIDGLRECAHRPRLVLDRAKKMDRATERLFQRTSRKPSPEELRGELGEMPESTYRSHLSSLSTDVSTEKIICGFSGHLETCGNTIIDEKSQRRLDQVAAEVDAHEMIDYVLDRYGVTQALILRGFFIESRPMKEVAGWFGVSESRVSQRLSGLLTALRGRFAA